MNKRHARYSRITIFVALMSLLCSPAHNQASQHARLWLRLRSGETLTGDLVRIDPTSADFKVKGILQSVPLGDVASVAFASGSDAVLSPVFAPDPVYPMSPSLKPHIVHRETPFYTVVARDNKTQGVVILSVVFHSSGRITDVQVIRGVPDGLTASAIGAAHLIRFTPAMKGGKPVSVRATLEFPFHLLR